MNKQYMEKIVELAGENNILLGEPMSKHTSFRIGGEAEVMVFPDSVEKIRKISNYCRENGIPLFIMGNGTNLLVRDGGIDGVVMNLSRNLSKIEVIDNRIYAEAGALLSMLSKTAERYTLTGLEFAEGIPGTVGGGVVMNAGAYDGEMSFVTDKVFCMNPCGEMVEYSRGQHQFGYRKSVYQETELIVCSVELQLEYGIQTEIEQKMRELSYRRRSKQPVDKPSAGSVFKRPKDGFTAPMIEACNLKGFTVGGAMVSDKHCGFIINRGDAKADDVIGLIECIKEKVLAQFGIELQPEIKIVGKDY